MLMHRQPCIYNQCFPKRNRSKIDLSEEYSTPQNDGRWREYLRTSRGDVQRADPAKDQSDAQSIRKRSPLVRASVRACGRCRLLLRSHNPGSGSSSSIDAPSQLADGRPDRRERRSHYQQSVYTHSFENRNVVSEFDDGATRSDFSNARLEVWPRQDHCQLELAPVPRGYGQTFLAWPDPGLSCMGLLKKI